MNILKKKILFIIILWILLSVDFLINFDTRMHMIFHIIIGIAGTYYIIKNVI